MTDAPLFTILTPVYNTPLDVLQETVASVLAQTFEDWEWVLVDDHSPDGRVREVLHGAARRDDRIRVVERDTNGHIVVASNDGLAVARGEFIALLDHDDLIEPQALARVHEAIQAHPDVDYIYSDEDKVGPDGRFFDDFKKPIWSPERLLGQMYTCHFSVLRRTLVERIGGFRQGFQGSQDHDLVLRATEASRNIVHVPETLYHWRVIPGSAAADPDEKPYAREAGIRAVQESLVRRGIPGKAIHMPNAPGNYRILRTLPAGHKVSLVTPTRGGRGIVWGTERVYVVEMLRSALASADYPNLEVVVVYDVGMSEDVLDALRDLCGDRLVLVPYAKEFNFSEKMNLGVLHSSGDLIVMANDDLEVLTQNWIGQLLGPLVEPDVGMTGAKLYYTDSTIQHAGHQYEDGVFGHPYLGVARQTLGPFCELVLTREVSGVTAALAGIRREVFERVGGFSELLPVNFNDADLSLKVRGAGYRILWMGNCEAYHFESRTRVGGFQPFEREAVVSRWGVPKRDSYMPGPKTAR